MLTVSPQYAYGSKGLPPVVKPHSALKFDIELISWRTPPMWTKPLILAEEDIMTSDKDLYFWDPESLVEDFQKQIRERRMNLDAGFAAAARAGPRTTRRTAP